MTQFFAQFAMNNTEVDRMTRPEVVYERFRKMDPKDFGRTTDPIVVEGWIKIIEVIFTFMELHDADRVRCATYFLKDDARLWWEGASVLVNLQTLTWEGFKEVLYSKYFTDEAPSRLTREFMALREKLRHFMDGLRSILHCDVRIAGPHTYVVAVARALAVEQDQKDIEIYNGFMNYLGVKPTRLDVNYSVTVPSGEELCASGVVRDLSIELQGHTIYIDLIVLLMPEFVTILRMDWLSKNGVSINFRRKSVRVRPLGDDEFVFETSGRNSTPQMISCLQARKLMLKGCQMFLASNISAHVTTCQTVVDVPVVRDFPEVFPKYIVGIPPERELEFSIDLMSYTMPISEALYRLAPAG
ncbi:uncharacterized protein LOC142531743 [Primulina tabacum]|uniref:uncharacterized protein LOC142531743 n=1 Tax=Primulina tabacum TaxID=48773 RepID=UPI003F59BF55